MKRGPVSSSTTAGVEMTTATTRRQPSVGITYVLINGQIVLRRGEITAARPGRGLRGPGWIPSDRRGKGAATSG